MAENAILRTDAEGLIPEEQARGILQDAAKASAVLTLAGTKTTMARGVTRQACVTALPYAYFRDGDTGMRKTTKMAWENKYLNAEPIDAIVPIPETVLADAEYDIWAELRPRLAEAVGRALDAAVFFGTNKPASWPDALATLVASAGHTVAIGTNTQAEGGIAQDLSDVMTLVEATGNPVTAIVAKSALRGMLRGARDANGQRLPEVNVNDVYGVPVTYAMDGLWPSGTSKPVAFCGDFGKLMLGIRQDITYKVLDQAVIQDTTTGAIVYNLAQQGMVALMVTARFAYQVANPYTHEAGGQEYPFAALVTAAV